MRVAFLATLAACVGLFVIFADTAHSVAAGQQGKDKSKSGSGSDSKKGGKTNDKKGKIDQKTKGDSIRVSHLLGMNVRNSEGKDGKKLGDIEDVMLQLDDDGRVRYAALSFGGFLGIGNKLFAVPWRALKFHHDADRDKNYVVFDVTEETLKNTPGFDKDHWPDMADRRWMQEVDKHHGVDVYVGYVGNAVVEVRIETPEKRTTAAARPAEQYPRLHRGSEAVGMTVKNAVGDKLGTVEDMVIDMNSGDIRYLALSFGGFLGMGDKFFAIPCQAASVQYDAIDNEYFLLFDVTKDQLEKADGFDKDQWPDSGNDDWTSASREEFKASDDSSAKNGK